MKPLLVNSMDLQGGAAIATYRLHRGLRRIGVDSTLLVQHKSSRDETVVGPRSKWTKLLVEVRPYLDRLPLEFYRNRDRQIFSPAMLRDSLATRVAEIDPDIVHLFWVAGGFLRPESLARLRKPLVWTLHDMWAFTGGCHYDGGCEKYRESCGACPVLRSNNAADLSSRVWSRKQRAWKDLPMTIVGTSRWLANCARSSSLFGKLRVEVLPNGIDEQRYKPIDKAVARNAYNLPQDKHLILFSAENATTDPRKGFQFLVPALQMLAAEGWGERAELVVVGASEAQGSADLRMKAHFVGRLQDEISQVLLYSAADVKVAPSVQENLANSVMESLACGTPVVAFDIGGMPDMIQSEFNGYLATPFEPRELARGIAWVLDDSRRLATLASNARQSFLDRYRLEAVATSYRTLYEDVLASV